MSIEFGFNARVWEDELGRKWVAIRQDYINTPKYYIPVITLEEIQADEHRARAKVEDDIFHMKGSKNG